MAETNREFDPSREDLMAVFDLKYRRGSTLGWGPKTRLRFDYFNPDDRYEALVAKLVRDGVHWADIGCGRDVFPSNPALAAQLAKRCEMLFGIDPNPNIRENRFITDGFEGMLENCVTDKRFDLITLRMVAEHITDPARVLHKLAELAKPGGRVVVYTPNKWSPISLLAAVVPNRLHHRFKRLVWDVQARDTFPTAFKLNTRAALSTQFAAVGMVEEYFTYLDDCRTFSSIRSLSLIELSMQRMLSYLRIRYPENCLLGIYRKRQ